MVEALWLWPCGCDCAGMASWLRLCGCGWSAEEMRLLRAFVVMCFWSCGCGVIILFVCGFVVKVMCFWSCGCSVIILFVGGRVYNPVWL